MTVATINAHVDVAQNLKNKVENMYVGIGKSSEWENDLTPPTPDPKVSDLQELIGLKKVTRASLCRPIEESETTNNPTIEYKGQTWVLVSDDKAREEQAYFVYIEARIEPDDFPSGEYRQVGVYTGVKTDSSKPNIQANEVDESLLEFYENRPPYNRQGNARVVERFIVEC